MALHRYQSVDRLNRTAATELTDALRQRDDLVAAAKRVEPFRSALRELDDGAALAALVHQLGSLPTPTAAPRPVEDIPSLVQRFLLTLANSLDAVRYCRLTEHPSGRCWFRSGSGGSDCGEVLRLAHRLSH